MVKGVSKQVIVVNSSERELFDQAIFILSDEAVRKNGVTDECLLAEANKLMRGHGRADRKPDYRIALVSMLLGALSTAAIWALTTIF